MAVAIAWLPGPAGTRRRVAKPSVEEPDAAEPARPDLWGARVSNDPGLPDRDLTAAAGQVNQDQHGEAGQAAWRPDLDREAVGGGEHVHSSGLVFRRPQAASHRRAVVYFCSAVLTFDF